MDNLEELAEREYGGQPPDDLIELCHQVSCWIQTYTLEAEDFFAPPPGCEGIDMARLKIQAKLLDLVTEAIRLDRQTGGPEFFATVEQTFKPWVRRPISPLRSWIKEMKARKS